MYLLMVFVAASNIQAAYDNKLVATVFTETKKKRRKNERKERKCEEKPNKSCPLLRKSFEENVILNFIDFGTFTRFRAFIFCSG